MFGCTPRTLKKWRLQEQAAVRASSNPDDGPPGVPVIVLDGRAYYPAGRLRAWLMDKMW